MDLQSILTGGGLVLVGILVSPILTTIVEKIKRNWRLSDEEMERRIKIRNSRLDQLEAFLKAFIDDLFAAREQLKKFGDDVLEGKDHIVEWKNLHGKRLERQKDVYGYGPIINSLKSKIIDHEMNRLDELDKELWRRYEAAYTEYNKTKIFDGDKFMEGWEDIRLEANHHISIIYAEIDELRSKDPKSIQM